MTSQAQNSNDYFDLHTNGIGYLNRVRNVPVKRGESFWACDITALHGHKDDVQTTRFDCRVSGSEAEKLVMRFQQAVDEEKKSSSVSIGRPVCGAFRLREGDKKGQTAREFEGTVCCLGWVKVDGEMVYKAEPKNGTAPSAGAADETSAGQQQATEPEPAAVAA